MKTIVMGLLGCLCVMGSAVAQDYPSKVGGKGEWRQLVHTPDITGYDWDNGTTDEPCDFTIFQAADGTWQLNACVRNTTYPGYSRLLFHWESADFFATDWTPLGVFEHTAASPGEPDGPDYNEGALQAPHTVKDGDTYHMIYNSGNPHMMTSTNGKDWAYMTNSAGSHSLFVADGNSRDMCLFDNRDTDGKWYAYYIRDNTHIYYNTAPNLAGPWSDFATAYLATDGLTGDKIESPFVVKRDDTYYMWTQDRVHISSTPTNFPNDTYAMMEFHSYLYDNQGIAPEIIHHDGQDYIAVYAAVDDDHHGVFIRPMFWNYRSDSKMDYTPSAKSTVDSFGQRQGWNSYAAYQSPTDFVRETAGSNNYYSATASSKRFCVQVIADDQASQGSWALLADVKADEASGADNIFQVQVYAVDADTFGDFKTDADSVPAEATLIDTLNVSVAGNTFDWTTFQKDVDLGSGHTYLILRVQTDNVSTSGGDLLYFDNVDIYLHGDANRDGIVDQTDRDILTANWELSGKTWAEGDFNADGLVNEADLSLLIANWDAAGVETDVSTLTVDEGSTALFNVRLALPPSADTTVTVERISGDTDLSVQSGSSLLFTTNNWMTHQPVTLAAAEDIDGSDSSAIIRCSSPGLAYEDVIATENDDDIVPHIVCSTASVVIAEGATQAFGVKFDVNPIVPRTVTVSYVSGDTDITLFSGSPLVLHSGNWSTYQPVTLAAAQDADWLNSNALFRCSSPGLLDVDVTATEDDDETDPDYALPWSETFENNATNAGALGPLDGQHGWTGGGTVQTGTVYAGSQALSLTNETVSHTFEGAPTNIWVEFWSQPVRVDVPGAITSNASAVFYVNTNDQLVAYSNMTAVTPGATVSEGWNKFGVECDYVSKVWNLELNDELVVSNFPFYGAPVSFSAFDVQSTATATTFIDSIHLMAPGDPTDSDGDGLPNWWEDTYYENETAADPTAIASNGVNTVLETYIAGLDPTDPDAAFLISDLTAPVSGPVIGWNATSGRVYTVYWTSNLLSGFGSALTNGLPWTPAIFTDTTHSAEEKGFYKIEVELE